MCKHYLIRDIKVVGKYFKRVGGLKNGGPWRKENLLKYVDRCLFCENSFEVKTTPININAQGYELTINGNLPVKELSYGV